MHKMNLKDIYDIKKAPWRKREEIEKIKWNKVLENINYAYENVPFYKEKLKKAKIDPKKISKKEDLLKIPLTTKQEITLSNLSYISKKYRKEDLHTSRTSGSTGEPFISYFDKNSWIKLKYLSKFRARKAGGFSFKEKFVIIEAMPIEDANKFNSKLEFSKIFIRKRFLSVYDDIENHINFYKKFKPTTIYGFPSYFVNLVSYLEENSIKLDFVKRVFTSSEVLTNNNRELIENYFGFKIFDIYGSTEIKEVAWECEKHEGYHINEDLVYVECINDKGEIAKKGEIGQIVMTSLENKAMPLIRYSIGDTGIILDKKCSCGRNFLLMKPVYGRIIDYFILNDGRKISPYELTMSVEGINGITQYQILQKTKSLVEINLKVNKNFLPESKNNIISNLKKILGEGVEVVLNFVEKFNDNNSKNKFRVVRSEVKEEV